MSFSSWECPITFLPRPVLALVSGPRIFLIYLIVLDRDMPAPSDEAREKWVMVDSPRSTRTSSPSDLFTKSERTSKKDDGDTASKRTSLTSGNINESIPETRLATAEARAILTIVSTENQVKQCVARATEDYPLFLPVLKSGEKLRMYTCKGLRTIEAELFGRLTPWSSETEEKEEAKVPNFREWTFVANPAHICEDSIFGHVQANRRHIRQ